MSSSLPALRPCIRDSAVDALRDALLEGKFQPGESLSEPALASQMGVSRGPIREMPANPWLIVALQRVVVPFFLFTIMYSASTDQLDSETLERQHRAYLDYLHGGTQMAAEECVRLHLRNYEL